METMETNITHIIGDGYCQYSWNALPPTVQSDGDAILVQRHLNNLQEHDFMYYVNIITGDILLLLMCVVLIFALIIVIRHTPFKKIVRKILGLFIVFEEPKYEPELYRAISKATNGAVNLVECKDNCVHCGGNNWVRTQTRIKCQHCGIIK